MNQRIPAGEVLLFDNENDVGQFDILPVLVLSGDILEENSISRLHLVNGLPGEDGNPIIGLSEILRLHGIHGDDGEKELVQ